MSLSLKRIIFVAKIKILKHDKIMPAVLTYHNAVRSPLSMNFTFLVYSFKSLCISKVLQGNFYRLSHCNWLIMYVLFHSELYVILSQESAYVLVPQKISGHLRRDQKSWLRPRSQDSSPGLVSTCRVPWTSLWPPSPSLSMDTKDFSALSRLHRRGECIRK